MKIKFLLVLILSIFTATACDGDDDDDNNDSTNDNDDDDSADDDALDDDALDDDSSDDDALDDDSGDDDTSPGWMVDAGDRIFLADELGRALILHGANQTFSVGYGEPVEYWAIEDDFVRMRAYGFNLARLPVFWHSFERAEDNYDMEYLDRLEDALDWCADNDLLAIIDFHQDMFNEKYGGRGFPDWMVRDEGLPFNPNLEGFFKYLSPAVITAFHHFYNDADLQQAQIDAWMLFVNRFKDHPALLGYDLLNEPWIDKHLPWTFEAETLSAMYTRLIEAIREVDTEHWIFYEPLVLNPSALLPSSLQKLSGERLAYYPHLYHPLMDLGFAYNGNGAYFRRWGKVVSGNARAWHVPALIGEWGVRTEEDNYLQYMDDALTMADEVLAGWTFWHFRGHGGAYDLFDEDSNERVERADRIVRAYPRAVPGIPREISFDFETKVMVLRFEDLPNASGPTEIFIPESRHYPDGWTLAVSDPAGSWTSEWAAETALLPIYTTPVGGEHVITIAPAE